MAESRMLRSSILTSESVNTLSWGAEVFYRRLMSVVDDFGLFDGRIGVIRGSLYPLQLEKVGDRDIEKWLDECSSAALVTKYTSSGKPYLKLEKFGQRIRDGCKPKFPMPPDDIPRQYAAERGDPPRGAAYTETNTDAQTKAQAHTQGAPAARASCECPGFSEFWSNYPKSRHADKAGCKKKWIKRNLESIASEIIQSLKEHLLCEQWKRGVIPLTTTFINQSRWESKQSPAPTAEGEIQFDDPTIEQADEEFRVLGIGKEDAA